MTGTTDCLNALAMEHTAQFIGALNVIMIRLFLFCFSLLAQETLVNFSLVKIRKYGRIPRLIYLNFLSLKKSFFNMSEVQ